MSKTFRELTYRQMLSILDSRDIEDAKCILDPEEIKSLLAEIKLHPDFPAADTSLNQTFLALLLQEPTLPAMMLWGIVGSITIAFSSLAIITIATLGLMGLSVIVYGPITYIELRNRQKNLADDNKFSMLRLRCAETLIARFQPFDQHNQSHAAFDLAPSLMRPPRPDTTKPSFIKGAVGMGLLTSTTLFGTYYIGSSAVLAAFGLATTFASLTGPLGIGIVLGISLLAGLYFGYKHYQNLKREEKIKDVQNKIDNEIYKHNQCPELRLARNALTQRRAPPRPLFKQTQSDSDLNLSVGHNEQKSYTIRKQSMGT